jgi:hypothetical protein
VEIAVQKPHQKSIILLSRQLCNVGLEQLFFGLCGDSTVILSSAFAGGSRFDFRSVGELSLLSGEALAGLLSSESLVVDSEDALLQVLLALGRPGLLCHIRLEFLSAGAIAGLFKDLASCGHTEPLWRGVADWLTRPPPPPTPEIDSLIISQFPPLFEEFRAKHFNLLWRGSRDGFGAAEFHRRCDRRANTLTLISDTKGNVFGGFTPVKWKSREWNGKDGDEDNRFKGDDSLRSFLFTLKNPHGVPARKFVLRAEKRQRAISCSTRWGPAFGNIEITIPERCNTCVGCATLIRDRAYANNTAIDFPFTGAPRFTVKEIEVFEITDETDRPTDREKCANGR